uniref:AMP-dependent synthetase and ligase n=1 Tax=Caulobacter sp. (strain K31) TaxID=366602 RepID=B0T7E1_CAUSK
MSAVLEAVAAHAGALPQRSALSSAVRSWTYAELLEAVFDTADHLRAELGTTLRGRPVAVALDNGPAGVILDLALLQLGWTSLPLPAFFTEAQRAYAINDAGAGVLLSRAEGNEPAVTIAGERIQLEGLSTQATVLPAHTAKITYTSGSTGSPKGVCLSLQQLEAVAKSLVDVLGGDYAGRHLPLLPLSILLENVAGLYTTLIGGGEYRILASEALGLANPFKPDLGLLAAMIEQEEATSLILVPELLRALLMAMGFNGARFSKLNLVAVGGAKVAPQLLAKAQAYGLPVFEGYGLSECGSVVALNTPTTHKTGSVGRPLPHLTVTVSPEREIIVGPGPFLGYAGGAPCNGPVATGDLGWLDEEGFLRIDGRRSSTIINAFGRNIAPEWVESELTAQPEIRQALVFGEAKPTLGALIVPIMPDMDQALIAAAIDRANANLPGYAQVKHWRIRAPFDLAAGELTGNGRPRRQVLLQANQSLIDELT